MKIIYLLNKIANGEKVPKKIKYNGDIYVYVSEWEQYCDIKSEIPLLNRISNYNYSALNDEIEIIEELNNKIEMPSLEDRYYKLLLENEELKKWIDKLETQEEPKKIEKINIGYKNHTHRLKKIEKKLNEIVDYINKGDE